jgi:hypothetical protein
MKVPDGARFCSVDQQSQHGDLPSGELYSRDNPIRQDRV